MHVGGDGWLKTLDFVPWDSAHLADVLSGGERADGSSLFGDLGIPVGASDIVMRPRLSTAFIDPFAAEPTLAVLCSHYNRQGAPLAESPDTLVRAAYQRLVAETGVELHALGEIEFFLGARLSDAEAYGANERGYHSTAPFVFGETLRRTALVHLAQMGVAVKYGHAEVGYVEADAADSRVWEQHEIELWLRPLPEAADAVVLTQWVLRNLAQRAGMLCSFAPMARKGHAGSGMHFHFAPRTGAAYLDHTVADGSLTPEAKWLIGGLVSHGAAMMAFGNRSRDSFVRLSQGKEAPSAVTWGRYNRRALVRIPIIPTDDARACDQPRHDRVPAAGRVGAPAPAAGRHRAGLRGRPRDGRYRRAARADRRHRTGAGRGREPRAPHFPEIADALVGCRPVLEAGGVFTPNMMDRIIALLRA